MTRPVVRFAPSPTGRIHIGNARTALLNALFAARGQGTFILRFDDTDVERSKTEYAESIEADLAWLGLQPAHVVRQSDRVALYAAAATALKTAGRLYPCYETAEELDRRRKRLQGRGLPPIYDRAALSLTEADRAALQAQGRRPHWRFRLDPGVERWDDLVRGASHIEIASLSDPVLVREDGSYLYTLPSVVDDIDLGITHVIRGEDHVTNTAVQIQIYRALGAPVPVFGHHNLLMDMAGDGLSKRTGALSLTSLRQAGVEPLAVAAMAVLTGSSVAVRPVQSLDELGVLVELAHLSRAPARFDEGELRALSARTLHGMAYALAAPRLEDRHITGPRAEAFWAVVRGNLEVFDDASLWWDVVSGTIDPVVEDRPLLDQALGLLPPEPWDGTTWAAWTGALKVASGRKGKALFHPLRLALTGRETGPELAGLLPLIGIDRVRARLGGSAS